MVASRWPQRLPLLADERERGKRPFLARLFRGSPDAICSILLVRRTRCRTSFGGSLKAFRRCN
jgi:hypothetical protein